MSETEIFLSVDESARRLGLGRTFFYSLLRRGEIVSVKVGRCRRVPVAALEAFARDKVAEALESQQAHGIMGSKS